MIFSISDKKFCVKFSRLSKSRCSQEASGKNFSHLWSISSFALQFELFSQQHSKVLFRNWALFKLPKPSVEKIVVSSIWRCDEIPKITEVDSTELLKMPSFSIFTCFWGSIALNLLSWTVRLLIEQWDRASFGSRVRVTSDRWNSVRLLPLKAWEDMWMVEWKIWRTWSELGNRCKVTVPMRNR